MRFLHGKFISNTICALASGHGKCAVSIIRVSGTESGHVLKQIIKSQQLPLPRMATLKKITNPNNGRVLDKGLVLWFPEPNSFTGEDSFELQVHGGKAIVTSIVAMLTEFPNVRLALPGEFIRRAFNNGKFDLTEIEGIADLINAETEAQRKQAYEQSDGALKRLFERWKEQIKNCLAQVEVEINFSETEEITVDVNKINSVLRDLIAEMDKYLKDAGKAIMTREGIKMVLFGPPNVGKSSFLNALCQSNKAIVSEFAGTTRDVLEVHLDIAGYAVHVYDTAGLRENPSDVIEIEGIRRANLAIDKADICVLLADLNEFIQWKQKNPNGLVLQFLEGFLKNCNLRKYFNEKGDITNLFSKKVIIIFNKMDLTSHHSQDNFDQPVTLISAKTNQGLDKFLDILKGHLHDIADVSTESVRITNMRHCRHLSEAKLYLEEFVIHLQNYEPDMAISAHYLQSALTSLGYITGNVINEEILDIIFKNFCIGK